MSLVYSQLNPSSSVGGTSITISATTSGSPDAVHSVPVSASADKVTLYAWNNHTADVELTIQEQTLGGPQTIILRAKSGPVPIMIDRIWLPPRAIVAWASVTGVVTISGIVTRTEEQGP